MRRACIACLAALAWLVMTTAVGARPGGGESFSSPDDFGGGHSRGPSDGGDGVELVFFLIRLIVVYPKLGVPIALGVLAWLLIVGRRHLESWETPHHVHVATAPFTARARGARDALARLEQLRALDPDFSRVLFEDFAYRLYASVQRARSTPSALDALAPYLSEDVRGELLRSAGPPAKQVLVGALRIEDVALPAPGEPSPQVRVQLLYEANLTLEREGQHKGLYCRERWTLARAADARTKPPGSYERLGCPNCAAPFRSSDHRRCDYCHQVVADGRFNWQLIERRVLSQSSVLPALGTHAAERGTDKPSVLAPDHDARWRALLAKDPALREADFEQRLALIYAELNRAWTERELSRIRALVSDGMFDYLGYWVEAYRAHNLRNVLKDMHIERRQRVKVIEDRYFDAVTLRIFARGLDFTVRADSGALVSGDPSRPRRYSEYWTLIRGAAVRGAAKAQTTCPNCAAPLQASMAGTCAYCSAHITNGEFDWVLSKIEQDDVYDG